MKEVTKGHKVKLPQRTVDPDTFDNRFGLLESLIGRMEDYNPNSRSYNSLPQLGEMAREQIKFIRKKIAALQG